MPRRTRNVLVVIAAVFAVGVACDSTEEESSFLPVQVTLVNSSDVDVHLLGPGETMSAANRVPPGGTRSVTVEIDLNGVNPNTFDFRVERPEGVLGTRTCASRSTAPGKRVVWDGSALTCEGW